MASLTVVMSGIDAHLGSKRYLYRICELLDTGENSSSAVNAKLDLLGEMTDLKLLKGLQPSEQ